MEILQNVSIIIFISSISKISEINFKNFIKNILINYINKLY